MSHPTSSLPLLNALVIVFPHLQYVSDPQNRFLRNVIFRKINVIFPVVYPYVKHQVEKKPTLFFEMLDVISVIACDPFIHILCNDDLGN